MILRYGIVEIYLISSPISWFQRAALLYYDVSCRWWTSRSSFVVSMNKRHNRQRSIFLLSHISTSSLYCYNDSFNYNCRQKASLIYLRAATPGWSAGYERACCDLLSFPQYVSGKTEDLRFKLSTNHSTPNGQNTLSLAYSVVLVSA